MSAVALAVGVGVAAVGAGIQAGVSSSASGKAAKAQQNAANQSMQFQVAMANAAWLKRLESVANANNMSINSFLQANPQYIQGYQQASQILGQTFGAPATAATKASGTPPEQLAKLNATFKASQSQWQEWNNKTEELKRQLDAFQFAGPASMQQLVQLQKSYNEATVKRDAAKKTLDSTTTALQNAKPYVPAQAAQKEQVGRAPQALMTGADDARKYLSAGYTHAQDYLQGGHDKGQKFLQEGETQ